MGNRRQVVLEVVLWVFALFLAWVFIRQGADKFSDTSGWARAFRAWHFPDWFRVLIGVAEITAALLQTKRTAFAGAIIIIVIMLGAMGTHVYWGRPGRVTSEFFLCSWRQLSRSDGAKRSSCTGRRHRPLEHDDHGDHCAAGREGARSGRVTTGPTPCVHTTRAAV